MKHIAEVINHKAQELKKLIRDPYGVIEDEINQERGNENNL